MNYQSTHWRDWINERFGDKSRYIISVDEHNVEYTIQSSNPEISTRVFFIFMRPDDDDVLYDIQFSGSDSPKYHVWPSPFTDDPNYKPKLIDRIMTAGFLATPLIYTKKFVERLEKEWLHIPIQHGWTEEIYYVGAKIYQAKLRINDNLTTKWDIDTHNLFGLYDWDYIKSMLRIGVSAKTFQFEPMDKKNAL